MIYFVERADGRVKIGFLRSLYSIDLDLHGGRLIALVEGSAHRLAAIRKLFENVPRQDGWYLLTSGIFLFVKEHAIENSPDPELRAQWFEIVNRSDNGGRDIRNQQFDAENVGWNSSAKRRAKFREPIFEEDD